MNSSQTFGMIYFLLAIALTAAIREWDVYDAIAVTLLIGAGTVYLLIGAKEREG